MLGKLPRLPPLAHAQTATLEWLAGLFIQFDIPVGFAEKL